ncbi:unnamed protein product, partial [Amoebophrya sp. A120]
LGATNSGKTHSALQECMTNITSPPAGRFHVDHSASSSSIVVYCAPLRILAFEKFNEMKMKTRDFFSTIELRTGQETEVVACDTSSSDDKNVEDKTATKTSSRFIACTTEMFPSFFETIVSSTTSDGVSHDKGKQHSIMNINIILDEFQLLFDPVRGPGYLKALMTCFTTKTTSSGAAASDVSFAPAGTSMSTNYMQTNLQQKVHLCGFLSPDEKVEKRLLHHIMEKLLLVRRAGDYSLSTTCLPFIPPMDQNYIQSRKYERLNGPLHVEGKPCREILPGDCIIA